MDIQSLMRQAQEMQRKMQKAQEELAAQIFEGNAGGGMVVVSVTGTGIVKGIKIDPSLMIPEEKEILEDLLVTAFNDAKNKADDASSGSIKAATGGMNFPAGFKI